MTDSEREEVWSILNAISCFVSDINERMEYVVFPKEQRKMQNKIQKALKNMNFFETKEVKEND